MLETFLKKDVPVPVAEHPGVVEARAQLAEAEQQFQQIEKKWRRCDSICRPAPGSDAPADAFEAEIERSYAEWPGLRKQRYDAKAARDAASAHLATVTASAKRAREAYWLERLADSYEHVVETLDREVRRASAAFLQLRQEAALEEIRPEPEQPGFLGEDGLDFITARMREKIGNWRQDAERFRNQ